jgi:hypothetical protein
MNPTAREQEGETPRSRLLARRALHDDDARVLDIIASLPPASTGERHSVAGICNSQDQDYRRVDLFSVLELFMFIARLNALGFVQESGLRAGKHSYDVVFRKLPKRRASQEPVG